MTTIAHGHRAQPAVRPKTVVARETVETAEDVPQGQFTGRIWNPTSPPRTAPARNGRRQPSTPGWSPGGRPGAVIARGQARAGPRSAPAARRSPAAEEREEPPRRGLPWCRAGGRGRRDRRRPGRVIIMALIAEISIATEMVRATGGRTAGDPPEGGRDEHRLSTGVWPGSARDDRPSPGWWPRGPAAPCQPAARYSPRRSRRRRCRWPAPARRVSGC